jgi:two-component system sensor histidine kinase PilS (NtrC family)
VSEQALRSKLLWLMVGRASVVTVLLGTAVLVQLKSPGSLPVNPFFFVIGLTYALTAIYVLLLKQACERRWIVDVQLASDAALVSALVYLTGGVDSYFTSLYTLPIIAATVVRPRGGVMVGAVSAVLYALLVGAQYQGLAFQPEMGMPPAKVGLFLTGLNVFGFLAVALLGGYLAEGLRRADAQLLQTSTRLADLQAFSRYVIDSLASGLATTTPDGILTSFNRAAEGITGIAAADALGQPIASVLQLPPRVTAFLDAPRASDAAPAELPRAEFPFRHADGRVLELGASTTALQTPPGGVGGYIFTFRDVTESRRQEREAQAQQRLAAVGEMAAGIAHEIRNPLASMSGSIQILRHELPLTEDQAQLMDIVLRESDRLNDTIRNFLTYARPQRQTAVRFDLRLVLTDAATLLQNSPERDERHRIVVEVPDDPVTCLAAEAQIRQIVWNLASNGLRAMPEGGTLTLTAGEEPGAGDEGGCIALAVTDTGVGIDPADLDHILQPFRGGFSRGAGLGLSIVHRLVTDHGGELQVRSARGAGTTVTVTLPLARTECERLPEAVAG